MTKQRYSWAATGMVKDEAGSWVLQSESDRLERHQLQNDLTAARLENERLQEVLTFPIITPEASSSALFIRTLREHEKGQPVNGQDLINALMWRVKNQRQEIARLQAKRGAAEPSERQCACIPLAPRTSKYCGDCGGRIPAKLPAESAIVQGADFVLAPPVKSEVRASPLIGNCPEDDS